MGLHTWATIPDSMVGLRSGIQMHGPKYKTQHTCLEKSSNLSWELPSFQLVCASGYLVLAKFLFARHHQMPCYVDQTSGHFFHQFSSSGWTFCSKTTFQIFQCFGNGRHHVRRCLWLVNSWSTCQGTSSFPTKSPKNSRFHIQHPLHIKILTIHRYPLFVAFFGGICCCCCLCCHLL